MRGGYSERAGEVCDHPAGSHHNLTNEGVTAMAKNKFTSAVSTLRDLPEVQQQLIDCLESLSAAAKRGELTGLAFIGCWANGRWNCGLAGAAADDCLSHVLLGTSRLQHQANVAMDQRQAGSELRRR